MAHIALLGDSIFDNGSYVPGRPAVIDQLRGLLPAGSTATLLAVDGHTVAGIERQLTRLPADATHLFISVGGNDALGESAILSKSAGTVADALDILHETQRRFRLLYRDMLSNVLAKKIPAVVCTVYDSVPVLGPQEKVALGVFNEVILREAFAAGIPVIDLRLVCDAAADYSHISPIEPSETGGAKIAAVIASIALNHNFTNPQSTVYR